MTGMSFWGDFKLRVSKWVKKSTPTKFVLNLATAWKKKQAA